QQEVDRQATKTRQEEQARETIKTALQRFDDHRRQEKWQEGLLILREGSTHLADANSPALEERLRQGRAAALIATRLQHVRESSPFKTDGTVDYQQRAAEYEEVFERAGLRFGDDTKAVEDFIRASAIRDQLIAAVEDRALVAFMLHDDLLVERLLGIARSADPEPRWRDRFRHAAVWRSRVQLLRLADDALSTAPAPRPHQLA